MARQWVKLLWMASIVAVALGWASQASAQNGTLMGRITDADRRTTDRDGKPLAGKPRDPTGRSSDPLDRVLGLSEAVVTFELQGDNPRKFQAITDAFGEFYKSGLPPGTYNISARREWRDPVPGRAQDLIIFIAEQKGVVLKPGEKLRLSDIPGMTEEAWAAGRKPPTVSNMSNAEAEAANKRNAELEAILKDAIAAANAGKHEEAIAQFEAYAKKAEDDGKGCPACYVKIGESQVKLKNPDKAEAAFKKAIEQGPDLADPYNQLAALYNGQRRFDEAAEMSKKAAELMSAGGGGGDALTVLNQGIIFWNAGQMEEAKAEFAKAVKIDANNAKAQYWLGMATFSLASSGKGALIDAKAPFEAYLKLEPNGEYAETAKALLATIK